jgi:hypothetical protein
MRTRLLHVKQPMPTMLRLPSQMLDVPEPQRMRPVPRRVPRASEQLQLHELLDVRLFVVHQQRVLHDLPAGVLHYR